MKCLVVSDARDNYQRQYPGQTMISNLVINNILWWDTRYSDP